MHSKCNTDTEQNQVMTEEQFDCIVEAIATGKYSWACLLILRFAGYNPLHYIPYRTYIRLMKKQLEGGKTSAIASIPERQSEPSKRFRDLPCLEEIDRQSTQIVGGTRFANVNSVFDLIAER